PAAAGPAAVPSPADLAQGAPSDRSLAALPNVLAQLVDSDDAAANLLELLRAASRHCRKLVDCERARIWLARRAGARLVARDFPDGGEEAPTVRRLARGEGLAGWVFPHQRPLRLAPGDRLPELAGEPPRFESALVLPLHRRGEVFA